MTAKQMKNGDWVTRRQWDNLAVTMYMNELYYLDLHNMVVSKVTENSSLHTHTDLQKMTMANSTKARFYRLANALRKDQPKQKGNKMSKVVYENEVVVVTDDGVIEAFKVEAEALEWISAELEESPRTKFKMFAPYQVVAHKAVDLSELITKL